MSGPDPNKPITNVSPVVSQPQGGAPQGAAPAYIAPSNSDAAFQSLGGAAPSGGSIIGAVGGAIGSGLGRLFNAAPLSDYAPPPAAAAPAAPTNSTDVTTAPKPPTSAAGLKQIGVGASTYNTGEQHPSTHTLEDFVNQNRHLTLHDIKSLMPGIVPSLDPHKAILSTAMQGLDSQRQKALDEATAMEAAGNAAGAKAHREKNLAEYYKGVMSLAIPAWGGMAAANAYGNPNQ